MKENTISVFMLERYRHGELSLEDKNAVEKALASDAGLRSRLESLDASDRELAGLYPASYFHLDNLQEESSLKGRIHHNRDYQQRKFINKKNRILLYAAAIFVCILLPVFILFRNILGNSVPEAGIEISALPPANTDRPKGQVPAGAELFIYLKDNQENVFSYPMELGEGDTVQLAYSTPAEADYYGVIFSIDGRSVVTMHYPYSIGQSSLLVSGKRTFLNEAYTLDDAPEYEIFVFVVSQELLELQAVLQKAQKMAAGVLFEGTGVSEALAEAGKDIFNDCEVKILTVLKK